jgi:hypothetical protein
MGSTRGTRASGRRRDGPARTTRSRAAKVTAVIWAFAAFLLIVAAAVIVVGIHDAALSRAGFGVTAGGAVLVALGAVLSIAAYRLVGLALASGDRGRGPPSRLVIPLAFFLTILLGVYVFFAGIRAASEQQPVVVVISLLFIGVGILGLRFFPFDLTRRKVGAAVALGLLGTLIGAWEFWYQNQYVPSRAGHAVALEVGLRRETPVGAYEVVKAALGYKDVGANSVSVLGSAYTLTGSRVVRCHRVAAPKTVAAVFKGFLSDPQRARYMADVWEVLPPTVLAAGKFVGDGKRLDPDVASSRDLVFRVPRHEYQLLRFRAQVFAVPGSVPISQRVLPEYTRFAGDNELYGFWHIDDDSWFHDLVYGRERWVVLRYEIVDPGNTASTRTTPDVRVTARFPKPSWGHEGPSQADVRSLFGKGSPPGDANEAFAGTELALGPIAEPSAREARRIGCE